MPRELDAVAEALTQDRTVEPVTVRVFLSWFDAQRRGIRVVREIREQLKKAGVETDPDFEPAYIEAPIGFHLTSLTDSGGSNGRSTPEGHDLSPVRHSSPAGDTTPPAWESRDPTYRISRLQAANTDVVRIKPDDPISCAVTLMLGRDFSQLPVMTTDREVKGAVSWRSIGSRLALGNGLDRVGDAMEQTHEVSADASIFDAIGLIVQHEYVLVRSPDKKISGIVTASDLSLQFRTLTEPFLVLSEIENLLRNMIGPCFTPEELSAVRNPGAADREVSSVADLSFGDYIRILEKPDHWCRVGLKIDCGLFCKSADRVRIIRNDVMHLDPDGITASDLSELQNFARFLKRLKELRL